MSGAPSAVRKTPALGDLSFPVPVARFLSNGSYTVMITAAGAGASTRGETALTPWTADPVEDAEGFFVWVRDLDGGEPWSAGLLPTLREPAEYRPTWQPGRFGIARVDRDIASRLEVCVHPERALEIRRLTLTNRSSRPRRLELTSGVEVALHDAAAHAAHPVFSKLFLQTEHEPAASALLVRRRPRAGGETHPWAIHAMPGHVPDFETDRARFLGRGRTRRAPRALENAALSRTVGSVLDPVLALRRGFTLEPGASEETVLVLGVAPDRAGALALVPDPDEVAEAFARAEEHERVLAQRLGLDDDEVAHLQTLAGAIRYGHPQLVAAPPRPEKAAEYWRAMGIPVEWKPAPAVSPRRTAPAAAPPAEPPPADGSPPPAEREALLWFNGFGGFREDGEEYIVRLRRDGDRLVLPPKPWINVVANESFGFLVSETGAGTTWRGNSREHRLTPWANDPVLDPPSEAFWVRDDETGEHRSLLCAPTPGPGDYEMRHGFGYSRCLHRSRGLAHDTTLFAPRRDGLRIARVRLTNEGDRPRRVSLFSCYRLDPGRGAPGEVVTSIDPGGTLLARRPDDDWPDAVTFAAAAVPAGATTHATCDRAAFIGRPGHLTAPAALRRVEPLDGACGAGLDPCFAQQVELRLPPGATVETAFLFGEDDGEREARSLAKRYLRPDAVEAALDEVRAYWRRTLSAVRIETPAPALDLLANGWLAYQTLACRIWGRTALYQSGGAFGFRDQLQDASALVLLLPTVAREQILRNASHQFVEGDVLHWWHPPRSRGLRTRFADDLLWLPYLTAHYVWATGDWPVLDEELPFLAARPLAPGEDEAFLTPEPAGESADLYEHCVRALDRSLGTGEHGLPLFGTGDWNDGMNRVGRLGRGESVWMGFFLYRVLGDFLPACERREDRARVERYRRHREKLRTALEESAWDGEWYRRGWYDDGTPLGTRQGDECRIDALAQAWSVISGAAPRERAEAALAAVERELVSEDEGLIRLLAPPFDETPHDPGYIKGYVPGVRENGGQYTHAALWVVRALAELGRNDRVAGLLELLSPVRHAATPERVARYEVEPYVVAADVYGAPPHTGRGGWTWYTGSSGWMLRVIVESLLGLRVVDGDTAVISPCVPDDWPGFRVSWRPDERTRWDFRVTNPDGHARRVVALAIDGRTARVEDGTARVPLARDGREHVAEIRLGAGIVTAR